MGKGPFYITTAISYVNGVPHLGHAYEAILTDVMARFKRLEGYNVYFLTGTDEHGEKVAKTAEEHGMSARDFADQNAATFKKMTGTLNISHDQFIRTTEDRHYKAAQTMWKTLQGNGDIYLDKYEGWYSVREEAYFTEDEIEDKDGEKFSPNGTELKWVEEESYFFKLSAYQDKLLDLYSKGDFVLPESRQNEITAFVKRGLRDLSISRHKDRLHWGIPVPGDENHVMYVWLDALTNYITALGYPDDTELMNSHWPADYHVIGKDITRFHAIYWPAFLMAADIALPKHILAHGFINVQGEKMSKSVGNVLSPDGLVETYGLDQIRYFLSREIAHGQDGNFSHEQAVQRINADLANGVGNLAQRTLSMIYKNCDGAIPEPNELIEADQTILDHALKLYDDSYAQDAADFKFHRILENIMGFAAECDRYVDEMAPWVLRKENPERMKTVLYVMAEALRCLGIALQPYTPEAMDKLLNQLEIPKDHRLFDHLSVENRLKPGTSIEKPEGLFPRIIEEEAA